MRSVILALALGAVLCAAAPAGAAGPVFAADTPKAGDKDKKHDDKGGIDLFKGTLDLTIWTIVVFLLLFFILRAYAWGPIRDGLDKRERAIAHDKHEAVRAKQEADALRTKLDAELARANDQVRQMMDKARTDAQAVATEETNRGKAELQAERERLQRDMATQRQQALQEAASHAVSLATLISSKAIKKNLSEADHRALLGEALAEFKSAAEHRLADLTSARA